MKRRSYNELCGLARALDVVGERWTLLVVRSLLLGPMRYGELLRGLPGITTNLLARRLRAMAAAGLVERVRLTASDAGHAWGLTELGRGLEPAIHALGSWGWHLMSEVRPDDHRNIEWLLVALRRRYRGGETLSAELVADDVAYRMVLTDESVEIGRGSPPQRDLRLTGPAMALARLFLLGLSDAALPDGVRLDGEPAALERLLAAFQRGDPVVTAGPVPSSDASAR
jgi:DNA-binding HxlR family transcriptional regulator